ncbi:RDD family protein [Mucilaginibacter terrae]|uniref:RDD family membrane protein YckC n=1 Tax=Mucilaginibacter terrae TaxID=1955052 RepID=A0ABU3GRU3_9SPHI|nr:RDD family protein [Mucilaginibacter terrae]MDT3402497.1 putative RDD family membrane protein YckC [Mucilaginibacter terrae]
MILFGRLRMLLLRTIAYLVDSFILFILVIAGFQCFLLILGLHPFIGRHLYSITGNELHLWLFFSVTIPVYMYYVTMFNTRAQATLGMRAVRLQIQTPGRMGLGKAMLRASVMLIPWEATHVAMCYPKPIWIDNQLQSPLFYTALGLTALYWLLPLLNLNEKSAHDWITGTNVIQWQVPTSKKP